MTALTEQQLELLSMFNITRQQLITEFKSAQHPSPDVLLKILLKLQVLLMENQASNNLKDFIDQNQRNLAILIKKFILQKEKDRDRDGPPRKKFDVNWTKIRQQIKRNVNDSKEIQISFEERNHRNKQIPVTKQVPIAKQERKDILIKQKQPNRSVEFMSANLLPKGTSVRKKFVPPFKKSQSTEMKEGGRGEGQSLCKQSEFKNLQEKLVQIILLEILEKNQKVKWSQIAGLGFAKKIIHEMIVWPMLRPDIFTGLRAPPRGILLFGPPGTGKTMIGRAIASEAAATFFSISASSLTSKWVGESEKLVKTLFSIARAKQPSVIFIDEIDSLLCSRSQGEQQSSRRMKTQFLIQLDGTKTNTNERVLIIGATNLPQELDDAVRRRFVKRLYIPLPNLDGRVQLIQTLTQNNIFQLSSEETRQLALMTKGFSGADLHSLCSEAAMIPLRELIQIQTLRHSEVPKANFAHFKQAFKLVRPSVNKKVLKSFQDFNYQYGSYQFSPDELEEGQNLI